MQQTIKIDLPLDCAAVAPYLGLSTKTVRRYVTESPQRLPRYTKTNTGRVLFWPADLLDWQAGVRQPAPRRGAPTKRERISRAGGAA
jgi:hypothetical protein